MEESTGDVIHITYIQDPIEVKDYMMVFRKNLANIRVNNECGESRRVNITTPQTLLIGEMDTKNILTPSKTLMEKLSKEHNIPYGTFNSAKDALITENTIIRTEFGKYMVNPFLFFKNKLIYLEAIRTTWQHLVDAKFKQDVLNKLAETKSKLEQEKTLNNYKEIYNEQNNN